MRYIKKLELKSRRVKLAENPVPYNTAISQPKDAARIINSILDGEEQEVFLVIPVDVKNKVLGYEEVHRGSVDECPVSMKTVFRTAVHMGTTHLGTRPPAERISRSLTGCGKPVSCWGYPYWTT